MNEAAAPTFFPFLMLLFFFLFVYFMTIRPQQKRKKEHDALVAALKKGDEVMTSSGIVGKIENVKAPRIAIEYYNLPDDARLVDLVKCVKADEEHHSEINHKYADEEIG